MFNGKAHYKLPFSIAMLVYQRVFMALQPYRRDDRSNWSLPLWSEYFADGVLSKRSEWSANPCVSCTSTVSQGQS